MQFFCPVEGEGVEVMTQIIINFVVFLFLCGEYGVGDNGDSGDDDDYDDCGNVVVVGGRGGWWLWQCCCRYWWRLLMLTHLGDWW